MDLTIKEASEELGIPATTIRFYERKGLLLFVRRDTHGNRLFGPKDLDWLRLMSWFRNTGMSVADLQRFAKLASEGETTIPQRQELLEKHKKELERRQEDLNRAYEAVNRKLEQYEAYRRDTFEREVNSRETSASPNQASISSSLTGRPRNGNAK